MVDAPYKAEVLPDQIAALMRENRLEGVVLRVRFMPDEAWFRNMETALENVWASVVVVQQDKPFWPMDPEAGFAGLSVGWTNAVDAVFEADRLRVLEPTTIRQIDRGGIVLHPVEKQWTVTAAPYAEGLRALADPQRRCAVQPLLQVIPASGEFGGGVAETNRLHDLAVSFRQLLNRPGNPARKHTDEDEAWREMDD
jgi:hypothetical protein